MLARSPRLSGQRDDTVGGSADRNGVVTEGDEGRGTVAAVSEPVQY